jgi:hypothetical protein
MSNQFDDEMERRADARIAAYLGLTEEELSRAPFELDTDESDDGVVYSLVLTFLDDADPAVLAKVDDLEDGNLVRLPGHLLDGPDGPED